MTRIIEKIKEFGLAGRGGGNFSVAQKWQIVKDSVAEKKYVICNGAEGEPEGNKDGYILDFHLKDVINGISLAVDDLKADEAYIYLRSDYYHKYIEEIKKMSSHIPLVIVKKPDIGYIAGEETVLCQVIEEKVLIPRKKPPFVSNKGLFGFPTLVNNIESFYCVSKISKDEYNNDRFYQIMGEVKNPGVFKLKDGLKIVDILRETDNYPNNNFFLQAGGVSGEIVLPSEINKVINGAGFIRIYLTDKFNYIELLKYWADFFHRGNCDKCTPCSEGFHLIYEMLNKSEIDFEKIEELLFSLKMSSFCALGKNAYVPFETLINKIVKE